MLPIACVSAAIALHGCHAGTKSETQTPMLPGQVESNSFRLYKICDRTNVGTYDQALARYVIDLELLLQQAAVETQYAEAQTAVRAQLARLPEGAGAELRFLGPTDREAWDRHWKSEDRMLRLVSFDKTGTISEPLLGMLMWSPDVPRVRYGLAEFRLALEDEVIAFRSTATRRVWSFSDRYRAELVVYLPQAGERERVTTLILVANDPNGWNPGHNGVYVLLPKP